MRATIDILKCLHLKRQDAEVVVGGIDTIIEKGGKKRKDAFTVETAVL